jgi:hypothetical protein
MGDCLVNWLGDRPGNRLATERPPWHAAEHATVTVAVGGTNGKARQGSDAPAVNLSVSQAAASSRLMLRRS